MSQLLSKKRLVEILEACGSLRVGVLGDFCLDAYFYVDMTRAQLSREAPLYNHPVVRETYSLGGAANVAWNLADLGASQVLALTILGDDWRGVVLRERMEAAGIRSDTALVEPGRFTPFYGKVILTGPHLQQEDARIDFVNITPLRPEAEQAFVTRLEELLPGLDSLVVADYQTFGVVTDGVLGALNELARRFPKVVFAVDSRERIGAFHGMVLKPNELEAFRAVFPGREANLCTDQDLRVAGRRLREASGRPVYLTLGERGCWLFDQDGECHLPAVAQEGPIDPVGAGDTFISALSAGLAAGAAPIEAGALACLASGVTLRKLHITGTASPDEIIDLYDQQTAKTR